MLDPKIHADWQKKPWAIATMHEKDRIIAPLLAEAFGVTTYVPKLNTDQFGTFTREIPRAGTQYEAARKKAQAALALSNATVAIASEGSFAAHPHLPFVQSNLELVLLIDREHGLEIAGTHRSSNVEAKGKQVSSLEEALRTAEAWGFPAQGIVVRTSPQSRHMYKEIVTLEEITHVCTQLLGSWFRRSIYLETDMRSHRCPARRESIREATKNLIENCLRNCPHCNAPGFSLSKTMPGLPCEECRTPTDTVKAYIYHCSSCSYEESREAEKKVADPSTCPYCNP